MIPTLAAEHPAVARAVAVVLDTANPNTARAYRQGWQHFTGWCARQGLVALPAEPSTVMAFLVDQGGAYSHATLQSRLAAISAAHEMAGHTFHRSHPFIARALAAVARQHGRRQVKAAALLPADLAAMSAAAGGVTAIRDRAMVLLLFAAALRRSELAALQVADVALGAAAIRLTIRRSKTDQGGEGRVLVLPAGEREATCPVRALRAWLDAAGVVDGALFRRVLPGGGVGPDAIAVETVRDVTRRLAAAAGIAAPAGERVSAHGFRAGFVTACVLAGVDEREAMAHTRHANVATFRGYARDARLQHASPAGRIGL